MDRSRVWILGLMLTLTVALVRADDARLVDNPEYHGWDNAPIGTVVRSIGTTKVNGTTYKTKGSKTLVKRSPDSLTIDVQLIHDDPSGQDTPMPVDHRVIPAKVPPERLHVPAGMGGKATITGQATITIAGREFKCDIVEIEATVGKGAAKVRVKQWLSNDLIGRTVRYEAFVEQDGETMESTSEFVSLELAEEKPN